MQKSIIYEQPLNERIRTFLRLEYLFDIIHERSSGTSIQDTRDTIKTILDVIDLLSRSDIKSELIKELERHLGLLKNLFNNPNVDHNQLSSLLDDLNEQLEQLHGYDIHPAKLFANHELITSVKQRSMITGGGCNFDLPNYHYWLNLPLKTRNELINGMCSELSNFEKSVNLCLYILRNMNSPTNEIATSGFFQKNLDPSVNCYLLRIILDNDVNYFPEISAGKHRFSIRFMTQEIFENRPQQIKQDVDFQLICCLN